MSVPLATAIADPGIGGAGHAHVDDLFEGVDDLIKRVADVDSPEILRVRAKVHAALVAAKSAFSDGANRIQPRPVAIVEHPWDDDDRLPTAELGVALLVGLGVALVAFPRQY